MQNFKSLRLLKTQLKPHLKFPIFKPISYLSQISLTFQQRRLNSFSTIKDQEEKFEIDQVFKTKGNKKLRGHLVICPTPIGNIKDISIRQYESLIESDIIACENPKVTLKLFEMFQEKKIKEKFFEKFEISLKEIERLEMDESEIKEEQQFWEGLERPEVISESKRLFPELDVISFMQNPDLINDETYFSKEDKFKFLLKSKVKDLRENRGRGLLVQCHRPEHEEILKLITCLKYGYKVALVSNQGTPTLMDLGFKLIQEAHMQNVLIEALPGANVFSVAMSLSGFPADRFLFQGYLPRNKTEKKEELERLRDNGITCLILETADRVLGTLSQIGKIYGDHQLVSVEWSLTKESETILRGEVQEVIQKFESTGKEKEDGMFIIIVSPHSSNYNKALQEGEEGNKGTQEKGYPIQIEELVKVLEEKLEVKDAELAILLADILKITKKQALSHIKRIRDEQAEAEAREERIEESLS